MSPLAALLGIAFVAVILVACRALFDEYDRRRDQREQAAADAERVRRALAAVNRRSLGDPCSTLPRAGSAEDFRGRLARSRFP